MNHMVAAALHQSLSIVLSAAARTSVHISQGAKLSMLLYHFLYCLGATNLEDLTFCPQHSLGFSGRNRFLKTQP